MGNVGEERSNKIDGLVIDEVALYLQVNEPRPWGVGKTSFARRLIDTLSSKGWNTIFIDLEEITSIDHFFNAFYGELVKLPRALMTDGYLVKDGEQSTLRFVLDDITAHYRRAVARALLACY